MKILFLESHPDDVALSCSGTLFKHQEAGDEIYYVCVSDCNDLPRNKELPDEVLEVMNFIQPDKEIRLDLPNTRLSTTKNREDMRGSFEGIRDNWEIDRAYIHWTGDIHQDHKAVAEEAIKTFRHIPILMYENVHSTPLFAPNYYVILSPTHVRRKLNIIKLFKSQSALYYAKPKIILNRLESRGIEVKQEYAEAFIVWRFMA